MSRLGAVGMASAALVGALLATAVSARADGEVSWRTFEPGLEYAEVVSPVRADEGDSLQPSFFISWMRRPSSPTDSSGPL